jgi:O-succinylbenzoic acid--CoA ligase
MVAANLRSPGLLKAIVVGGGHLNAETGQAARALGWPVLASYGMTEAASQIATQRLDSLTAAYQPSPIPLLPIWKAEVSNEQTLRISGEALFSGMLVLDDETWTFKPRAVAWHQTADRVALENDCLTPLGRADTLIKVLGELVDPEMIERELASLSEGKLAPGTFVVVAVPDARTENSLVPVFDAEVDKAIINAAMTTYAEHAPGFRRLTSAVYLEDFPRSPLGKPRRAEITARCVSRA